MAQTASLRATIKLHDEIWLSLMKQSKGSSSEKQRSHFLKCEVMDAALHNWTQQDYNGGHGTIENVYLLGISMFHQSYSVFFICRVFFFCSCLASGT